MLSRRARRRAALALAAIAVLYAVALAAARSAPAERLLRERIHAALRARVPDVRLDGAVSVDPLFRVWLGPVEVPAADGGPPLVRAERVMLRLSFPALLLGRVVPVAALHDVAIAIPFHGARLEAGPFDLDLRVDRAPGRERVDAWAALPGGGRATLVAAREAAGWRGTLEAQGVGPAALPEALRSRAAAIAGGALSARVEGDAAPDLSRATARARIELADAVLAGAVVGPEPVGPLAASASFRVDWDRAAARVELRDGDATLLGAIPVAFAGELHLGPPATFSVSLRAERVEYRDVLAALPAALAPPPEAPRPAGTLSGRLELAGPLLAPAQWTLSAGLDLAALREAARRGPRPALADSFPFRPLVEGDGRGRERVIGPPSPDFVPLAELPEHVLRAVTSSEDAGFFAHPGFDFDELRNAALQGAERGRVVRGGSTITQQVAKNLFLDGERTFARKVREAAIAIGLEATLPKRRILEIYLNVAEWGPGVWGIGPAARHWFGKDARALTPKEAAFLASVIPSPLRSQAMLERGAPTEARELRVRDLLFHMAEQGALSEAQLVEALDEPVVLASTFRAHDPASLDPDASSTLGDRDPLP
jgi:hypothetical protein